jgi:hypothetical protein
MAADWPQVSTKTPAATLTQFSSDLRVNEFNQNRAIVSLSQMIDRF